MSRSHFAAIVFAAATTLGAPASAQNDPVIIPDEELFVPKVDDVIPLAAASVPGSVREWYAARIGASASRAPNLNALEEEALLRARWSVTTRGCAAPISTLRLTALQPAHADRLVAEGIRDGAFVGAWTFMADTDCAEVPRLRYMYVLETGGGHIMLVVNRGDSLTTPSQMREASASTATRAYNVASAGLPDCNLESVGMVDAEILQADGALGAPVAGARLTGGWSERWTFQACGRTLTTDLRFDADGKGGATANMIRTDIIG
ncbi:MAG: hypothetical protein AAF205_05525 [Pseudomonadota bacterium]